MPNGDTTHTDDVVSVVAPPTTKRQRDEETEGGPSPKRARTAPIEDNDIVLVEDSADGAIVIDD